MSLTVFRQIALLNISGITFATMSIEISRFPANSHIDSPLAYLELYPASGINNDFFDILTRPTNLASGITVLIRSNKLGSICSSLFKHFGQLITHDISLITHKSHRH